MPTYYEILNLQPTATPQEVEAAYETQYTQWRRLVTHHDPQVVTQANQALQQLEAIRSTLLDAPRRAAYDAGIGVGGATGGLSDPTAITASLAPPPVPLAPVPPAPMVPVAPAPVAAPQTVAPARPGLWTCYKCPTENPVGTKFCYSCGAQLVRDCPECGRETSLVATGMCGECGYNYDNALQRRSLYVEVKKVQAELEALEKRKAESVTTGAGCIFIVAIGLGLLGLMGLVTSLGAGLFFLLAAGALFWLGYKNTKTGSGQERNLQAQIIQLETRKGNLQRERDALSLASATRKSLPEPGPTLSFAEQAAVPLVIDSTSVARIVKDSRGYTCSACGGYVRETSTMCKHCKRTLMA